MMGWLYFIFVQLVSLICMLIGWFLLIIPCIMKAWEPVEQIYQPQWAIDQKIPKKTIQIWTWSWLNPVWGNNEDGVVNGLRAGIDYNPNASRWLAYCWSAWRNSANNLRFVFMWKNGPFYRWSNATYYFQAGWYPNG